MGRIHFGSSYIRQPLLNKILLKLNPPCALILWPSFLFSLAGISHGNAGCRKQSKNLLASDSPGPCSKHPSTSHGLWLSHCSLSIIPVSPSLFCSPSGRSPGNTEHVPVHRVKFWDPSPIPSTPSHPPSQKPLAYRSRALPAPACPWSRPPEKQHQARGRWDYRKWSKDNPKQGPFIQEKSPSSRHHSPSQSPLNNSHAGMLQRLNLLRNVVLCSPDTEGSEPGEGGAGGGRGGREERKARQKQTHSAIFLLRAFVQPVRYLVI